jgi:hypothetical protein
MIARRLLRPSLLICDLAFRRKVALAYRTAREAGKSHHRAFHATMSVYLEVRLEEKADQRTTSEKVAAMRSSAVSVDPEWFWRGVRKGDYRRGG